VAYEFKFVRIVEFSETDMAGIVHFSNYCKYMEAAEHRFFRSIGYSIVADQTDPQVGWPRVHVEFDYKKPLRFEDEIEIHLLVARLRSKSITYKFRIKKINGDQCELAATGEMTAVCVSTTKHGTMKACSIPAEIAAKIEVAPTGLLDD
jgi:YbgC/YbaW family acyl-CoA thioester hydrolase